MQSLYVYLQQLEQRVQLLTKKIHQLEEEVKRQPQQVHYKIQEVHIGTLSGTLTIGTNGEVQMEEDAVDLFVNDNKITQTEEE